ncbi:MAG: choice-of-anchor tandem repeat NxxGxxAF-containing protein [Planctomycetota bacterium]
MVAFAATAATGFAQSLSSLHGEVVLAAGDPAPGIPGKTIYGGVGQWLSTPVVDQNGRVLLRARLTPSGPDDHALFLGHLADDMQLVAQSGSPHAIVGLPSNILLQYDGPSPGAGLEDDPVLSPDGGLVYFGSRLYDPIDPTMTPPDADSALFWGAPGMVTLLAREGDPVPGLASGVRFGPLAIDRTNHKINRSGVVTLPCTLTGNVTGANDTIVLTGSPSGLQIVIREGDDAGLGNGEVFVPHYGPHLAFLTQINDSGQILLQVRLAGPTVTSSNDVALAIWQPGAGLSVVARKGDQAPGLAAGVVYSGSPGAGGNGFTNTANLAFASRVSGPGITSANDRVVFFGGIGAVAPILQEGDPTGLPGGETYGEIVAGSLSTGEDGSIGFSTILRDAAGGALPPTSDGALFHGTPGNLQLVVRDGQVIPAIPASANGPWVCESATVTADLNSRGQMMCVVAASDGVATVAFFLVHDLDLGLRVARDQTETYTTSLGTGTATAGIAAAGNWSSSAGSPNWFNNGGDFVFYQAIDGGAGAAIVKGHSGSLIATPSFVPIGAGGTHTFRIDAGAANANMLYAVLGSTSGSYPGTVLPAFGPLTIPLNFDAYTSATITLFNTTAYGNTLGFTDGSGRATATFQLPAGAYGLPPGLYHHAVVGLDPVTLAETFVGGPSAVKLF